MAKGSKYTTKKKPEYITKKKKRLNESLAEVYGQVADRSRERLKKRGNIKIEDVMNKGKEDIVEAGKAMGGYKSGGKVCKLTTKGRGRAYGKNS